MKFYTMLSKEREEILDTQYPIVIEMENKFKTGSSQRKFREQFTDTERIKCRTLYNRAYIWHLKKGTPDKYSMTPAYWDLLDRYVAFCANL